MIKNINISTEEKLKHLKNYPNKNGTIEILNCTDIVNISDNTIPANWKTIFSESNKNIRIKKIIDIWQQHVGEELKNVVTYLNKFLLDVELMKKGDNYSVLYTMKDLENSSKTLNEDIVTIEDLMFYEGGNPIDKLNNNSLLKYWIYTPTKIKEFYENVHNGFYQYESRSMGLSDFNEIDCLDDYEWGILEEIGKETVKLDFKTSYEFFSNGGGSYVVIDYKNCENYNATEWSAKYEPTYNVDFWKRIDEWMVVNWGIDFDDLI